jgi:hypothetical protein
VYTRATNAGVGLADLKFGHYTGDLLKNVENKNEVETAVDKGGGSDRMDRFDGCHSAGQGGQLLFDNRYDVPESVRPHSGFEHEWVI